MVKLTLIPSRGNANSRYFPHSGYLGLTPVKIEGVARTALEEDRKPLLASSIVAYVRCIEARIGRTGLVHSNVLDEYSQVLWKKPDGVEWAGVANGEYAFKIIVPPTTTGFSSSNLQEYRVFWRIDVVIEHMPVFALGNRKLKSYEILLLRYDTRLRRTEPLTSTTRFLFTQKPRAPAIRYQLTTPTTPVGPLDLVTIPLVLHPVDSATVIRSASLVVERRIELLETANLPPASPLDRQPSHSLKQQFFATSTNSGADGSDSTIRASDFVRHEERNQVAESSNGPQKQIPKIPLSSLSLTSMASTHFSGAPSEQPLVPVTTDLSAKTISLTVAHVGNTSVFTRDSSGIYTKTLSLQWPASKSHNYWSVGETMQTEMASVRFYIHVKIIVSSPSSGTETIELEEREMFLVSTNESDRKLAASRCAEARSKSKAPRRMISSHGDPSGNSENQPFDMSPIPKIGESSSNNVSHHLFHKSPSSPKSSSSQRRPHTSAGPRDNASGRASLSRKLDHDCNHDRDKSSDADEEPSRKLHRAFHTSRLPETAKQTPRIIDNSSGARASYSLSLTSHTRRNSRDAKLPVPDSSSAGGFVAEPAIVHTWEQELVRIQTTSRRTKKGLLGFSLRWPRARTRPKEDSSSVTSESS